MVTLMSGDIMHDDSEALVNPVNTVGIMGSGLAAVIKMAYPAVFEPYLDACDSGALRLGNVHVAETRGLYNPRYVINFPTKQHYADKSFYHDVRKGLVALVSALYEHEIASVAVPALGCGLGGLRWLYVREIIVGALDVVDVDVRLYSPTRSNNGV